MFNNTSPEIEVKYQDKVLRQDWKKVLYPDKAEEDLEKTEVEHFSLSRIGVGGNILFLIRKIKVDIKRFAENESERESISIYYKNLDRQLILWKNEHTVPREQRNHIRRKNNYLKITAGGFVEDLPEKPSYIENYLSLCIQRIVSANYAFADRNDGWNKKSVNIAM